MATVRTVKYQVHLANLPETANALREFTRHLIQLRDVNRCCAGESWRDGSTSAGLNAGGGAQQSEQWDEDDHMHISRPDLRSREAGIWHDALPFFNPFEGSVPFVFRCGEKAAG